ncbi:hypothetical protein IGI37_003130 [Enterococcus sp. AZ194]|uniref:hypothetical protein n=1 Tax=Enterococcus sp. AZ194 TaxID=2774629 RepID=UPI003F278EC5
MAENQSYYDTQPTGENHSVDYTDPTDVEEVESILKNGTIDPLASKFALWIRTKMYRRHVREALARMMEYMSILYHQMLSVAEKVKNRQDAVEKKFEKLDEKFNSQLSESMKDGEVIAARTSSITGKRYSILGQRLDAIESNQQTIKGRTIEALVTLQDDAFSQNYEITKLDSVNEETRPSALFIGEIGNVIQDTFYLTKVGEVSE